MQNSYWMSTRAVTASTMSISSAAATAKAFVPSFVRWAVSGLSFGNFLSSVSLCVDIQRFCTAISSASWIMNASGKGITR